jgi:uncharacterized integral membrane protein
MKFILGLIFGIVMVIFIFQNIDVVEINFLFWSISISMALMIFLVLFIGIILGAILRSVSLGRDKDNKKEIEEG